MGQFQEAFGSKEKRVRGFGLKVSRRGGSCVDMGWHNRSPPVVCLVSFDCTEPPCNFVSYLESWESQKNHCWRQRVNNLGSKYCWGFAMHEKLRFMISNETHMSVACAQVLVLPAFNCLRGFSMEPAHAYALPFNQGQWIWPKLFRTFWIYIIQVVATRYFLLVCIAWIKPFAQTIYERTNYFTKPHI